MAQKKRIPIVEGLVDFETSEPALIVSKCKKCGTVAFPKAPYCTNPDCEKDTANVEVVRLNRTGKVFTYTHQIYSPPPPFKREPWTPYSIMMVDFPEGIRVLGMSEDIEKVKIGAEVETTVGKLYEDQDAEYVTWKFKVK